MKVTLLGTGSPVPSLKRASAGYMVEVGSDVVLIDHGPGCFRNMMQAGVSATDVTHVIFSHLHFDHCADFIRLFFHRWDIGKPGQAPMKVYGPPGLTEMVDKLFGPDGAFKIDLTARTNHPNSLDIYKSRGGEGARPWPEADINEVKESDVIEGEGWKVSLATVPHHQPYLHCYGVRFEADGAVFAYSSDISLPADKGPAKPLYGLAQDADLMVHYLNSFSFDMEKSGPTKQDVVGQLAEECNVKTLVTSHHGPTIDTDGTRERVIADVAKVYSGKLIWGEDLMSFELGKG
jgi:ribonuclease Z